MGGKEVYEMLGAKEKVVREVVIQIRLHMWVAIFFLQLFRMPMS